MQVKSAGYLHGSVRLSHRHKGKPRSEPVWELRYRLPSGKDSRLILGKAWTRHSRAPRGYMTEGEAKAWAQNYLSELAETLPDDRVTLRQATDAFLRRCELERDLAGATLRTYRHIAQTLCGRDRGRWAARLLDTFAPEELLRIRGELLAAGRAAGTLNQYRVVVRGVWGTARHSPALAWEWKTARRESEDKLRFYTPEQVRRLIAAAVSAQDAAIFALATQAGPRKSEIRALVAGNVDFAAGMVRFEDGFTNEGGRAGNKGRKVRSVPMGAGLAARLAPFCERKPAVQLVFVGERGDGPICGFALYRRFVKAAARAGLPRISFHDLRHTFGTEMVKRVDVHTLQRLMGHAHITTTQNYLHYRPDPSLSALMDEVWGAGEGGTVVPLRVA